MLYEFLDANREELISRCRAKAAERLAPQPTQPELNHGLPLFLEQFTRLLRKEQLSQVSRQGPSASPEVPAPFAAPAEMDDAAISHGSELLKQGFTVDQVVHDYGDLCQLVNVLAAERGVTIPPEEFFILNRCLDNAVAQAVTEYGHQRDRLIAARGSAVANERLGFLAHELRNVLNTAVLSVSVLRSGKVGLTGPTGALLDRSLIALRNLIDRSLLEVRLSAELAISRIPISVSEFIAEVQVAAALEAQIKGIQLRVWPIEPGLWVETDPHILLSAVSNLLQNAFKFTKPHSQVALSVRATTDSVYIEVADECGGLPHGKAEELFSSFVQRGDDRTGLGLGLSISRRGVETSGGTLQVRDLPGTGCVFTIELPRQQPPPEG